MLSGRRGQSSPGAEVERSTDSRVTFMMLRRRSVNSCRQFRDGLVPNSCADLPARLAVLRSSTRENCENCVFRQNPPHSEELEANVVPNAGTVADRSLRESPLRRSNDCPLSGEVIQSESEAYFQPKPCQQALDVLLPRQHPAAQIHSESRSGQSGVSRSAVQNSSSAKATTSACRQCTRWSGKSALQALARPGNHGQTNRLEHWPAGTSEERLVTARGDRKRKVMPWSRTEQRAGWRCSPLPRVSLGETSPVDQEAACRDTGGNCEWHGREEP